MERQNEDGPTNGESQPEQSKKFSGMAWGKHIGRRVELEL
jgi:hypothetical protein